MAAEVAPTNIPILLCGESGTGKEVLAHTIHSLSQHFDEPLTKIPCAWISADNFAEHVSQRSRPMDGGPWVASGTLFFDELGDLDVASQVALSHALRNGETSRTSGTIAWRLVSSTTRDLVKETRVGRFQSELYRRLNGICFRIPPLRERKEDLPALAQFLLAKHAARLGCPRQTLRKESLEVLLRYPWPGNIRELENVLVRILILQDEQLVVSELEPAFASAGAELGTRRWFADGRGTRRLAADRTGDAPGSTNTHVLAPIMIYPGIAR